MLIVLETSLLRVKHKANVNENVVFEKRDKDLTHSPAVGFAALGHFRHC